PSATLSPYTTLFRSSEQPLSVLLIRGCSDDSAPELRMTLVPIVTREGGVDGDVLLQSLAVDRFVGFFRWQKPPPQEGVFEFEDRSEEHTSELQSPDH